MVSRVGLTFPLASPSVSAALAAIEDENHVKQVFQTNLRLRNSFSQAMQGLGLKVYPSQTNFLLIEFTADQHSAAACAEYLSRQGISVRRFASLAYENCIRVTIGFEADMSLTAAKIAEFLTYECDSRD